MSFMISLFFGVLVVIYGAAFMKWVFAQGVAWTIGVVAAMLGMVGLAWLVTPAEEKAGLRATVQRAKDKAAEFKQQHVH